MEMELYKLINKIEMKYLYWLLVSVSVGGFFTGICYQNIPLLILTGTILLYFTFVAIEGEK